MEFPSDLEMQEGARAYNAYLARLWEFKQAELEQRAAAAAIQLAEDTKALKEITRLELGFSSPPELEVERMSPDKVCFRVSLPGQNGWGVSFRARVRKDFLFFRGWHTIRVAIKNLRVVACLEVDHSQPASPVFHDSNVDVKLGDLSVKSSNFFLGALGKLVSPLIEEVAERLARKSLPDSIPTKNEIQRIADLALAGTPGAFTGCAPSTKDNQAKAEKVSEQIAHIHSPFGTVLDANMAKGDADGTPQSYWHFGDSAIWTGHALAAEAFRYAVTKSERATQIASKLLTGLESLVQLTDRPGLLSRCLIPHESEHFKTLEAETDLKKRRDRFFIGSLDGRQYGSLGHITRDQYAGALMGTGLAAVLFDGEPELAARARKTALLMADYLVARHFCPTEATRDPATGTRLTSVTYIANPAQVLGVLQLARTLDPERYQDCFDEHFPMWSVSWFFGWLQALDPHDSYFKFNLEHATALLALKLEQDPQRKVRLAHAFRIQRDVLKYHNNAYFNLIELMTLGDMPELLSRPKAEMVTETLHLIDQMFSRGPLMEAPPLADDETIKKVPYRNLSSESSKQEEVIAHMPIPVPQRPGTDFLWQRSPFGLESTWPLPEQTDWRSSGVDRVLPYWMARYLGI